MRPSLVLSVLYAAGLAAVVTLWWADGPSPDVRLDLARLCGLLAAYLVAVQLILRSRIPYIENGIDTRQLGRWHRLGGLSLLLLAGAHAALVSWSYARISGRTVVGQAGTLVLSYPDVLMAAVALGLFGLVGVVSVRAVRRRLRYETWSHVHLYVYLAAALSIAHQLANGEQLARHPALNALWPIGYALIAAVLTWFRVLVPAWRSWRLRLRVEAVDTSRADVTSVTIGGRNVAALKPVPGQYFRWRFLDRGRWWSANPYSLSAAPNGTLRITAKAVGDHSAGLAHLAVGTRVCAEGPYGNLTERRARRPGIVLIGAGIGITPLRALFECVGADRVTLLYRTSRETDVLFRDELDAIALARGTTVHYLVGDRSDCPLGARELRQLVPDIGDRDAYVCGPPGFANAVQNALRAAGVSGTRIHTEGFALD